MADGDLGERSDEALVAAVNRGDAAAFEVLYYRYRDWVVNLAYRLIGDRELALDVLQETFLYWSKKFPGFELRARVTTFLYPAVRNFSIAARRKLARARGDEVELETLPAPEHRAGGQEELAAVLAQLPEEHREVLLLRFIDGMELAEIASAMEIPLGTVKSRLHYALKTLRESEVTKKYFVA